MFTGIKPGNSVPLEGYNAPNAYEDYKLVWSEEFEGSSLNDESWNYELGNIDPFGNIGWGNNELQFYKVNNIVVKDGHLIIEVRQENDGSYSSGRITTRDKKEYKYGRIDVRAALPNQRGMLPAIWMLGKNYLQDKWPICGEIDIAESFISGPETANRIKSNVSWGKSFPELKRHSSDFVLTSGNFSEEWHIFSLEWDENFIKFFVDGIQHFELIINEEMEHYFRNEFFLILNLAIGGNPVQNPDNSTVFPQRMFVDYIKVYQKL